MWSDYITQRQLQKSRTEKNPTSNADWVFEINAWQPYGAGAQAQLSPVQIHTTLRV